jgi:2-oxoglutarate dehydrogenase E1 component
MDQNKLTLNDNQPLFRKEKMILSKLNEAVSFENFLHTKYVGQNVFT